MQQNKKGAISISFVVVALTVLSVVGYWIYSRSSSQNTSVPSISSSVFPSGSPSPEVFSSISPSSSVNPRVGVSSIKILAPKGNDVLTTTERYQIRWTSGLSTTTKVTISLLGYNGLNEKITSLKPELLTLATSTANSGAFSFAPTDAMVASFGVAPTKYKVAVKSLTDGFAASESNGFFTLSHGTATNHPHIEAVTVTNKEDATVVSLKGTGFLSSTMVQITGDNFKGATVAPDANGVSTDGTLLSFSIPKEILDSSDSYTVQVKNGNAVSGTFTLVPSVKTQ